MPAANPFLDADVIPGLYSSTDRTTRRSSALLSAKIHGHNTADVVAGLAAETGLPPAPVIADIGSGRGGATVRLAARFPDARLIAIDASPAMVAAARARAPADLHRISGAAADFHALPLRDSSCDLAVAVFCLYHSPRPATVVEEIRRCLRPGAAAILVTKAADSYRELDELMAASGLDPDATDRPSLYDSAHGGILPELATALSVSSVVHDQHVFRFRDAAHVADYLSTVPKYQLPSAARTDPTALAAALRSRRGDGPVTATATITYVLGHRTAS